MKLQNVACSRNPRVTKNEEKKMKEFGISWSVNDNSDRCSIKYIS